MASLIPSLIPNGSYYFPKKYNFNNYDIFREDAYVCDILFSRICERDIDERDDSFLLFSDPFPMETLPSVNTIPQYSMLAQPHNYGGVSIERRKN